jgi:hypothetical protein
MLSLPHLAVCYVIMVPSIALLLLSNKFDCRLLRLRLPTTQIPTHWRLMAYVPEGSEHARGLHFHVSGGGTLKDADHTLRLLFKYPVDPLQCRKDVDVSLLHLHQ